MNQIRDAIAHSYQHTTGQAVVQAVTTEEQPKEILYSSFGYGTVYKENNGENIQIDYSIFQLVKFYFQAIMIKIFCDSAQLEKDLSICNGGATVDNIFYLLKVKDKRKCLDEIHIAEFSILNVYRAHNNVYR